MNGSAQHEITHLPRAWTKVNRALPNGSLPLVYEELRRLARSYVVRERPDRAPVVASSSVAEVGGVADLASGGLLMLIREPHIKRVTGSRRYRRTS